MKIDDAIVTTGYRGHRWQAENVALAKETAERLRLPYEVRGHEALDAMRERTGAKYILVAKERKLFLETEEGELFFHPNMAHLRIKNLRFGNTGDRMIEAMGLKSGMTVLDCTLGLGADAIVASYVAGPTGQVTALESNPLTEAVIHAGMRHFTAENARIEAAVRQIQTHAADALTFLREQEDRSFDVIYFDPMFRHPLRASHSLDPLRLVADRRPLTTELITEARRVARFRVVMKENSRSGEFERLGFPEITGGKYSKVHYGVIHI